MTFNELLHALGLSTRSIKVTLIKPLRNGDIYKSGELIGIKPGKFGGGGRRFKNGYPQSFASSRMRWLTKPKVCIAYNIFEYGGSNHTDWTPIDNCIFEIEEITSAHANKDNQSSITNPH